MSAIFISYHRPRCDKATVERVLGQVKSGKKDGQLQVDQMTESDLRILADELGVDIAELMAHKWLSKRLAEEKWTVWSDMELRAGDEWAPRIQQELADALCVVALCTTQSLDSKWLMREATEAAGRNKLIPVKLGSAQPETYWAKIQCLDITGWTGDANSEQYHKLVAAIEAKIGQRPGVLSPDERVIEDIITSDGAQWKGRLINHIANGNPKPIADIIAALASRKSFYQANDAVLSVLADIEYWLRDEKILVTSSVLDAAAQVPQMFTTVQHAPDQAEFPVEVWSKTDWMAREINTADFEGGKTVYSSLVVQCMFLVEDGKRWYFALHDRSYTGAEDAKSKYALVTGRLSWGDMLWRAQASCDSVQKYALIRELQEIDELNLSPARAVTLVDRARFVGVFYSRDRSILSFLHVVLLTSADFEEFNRRGPCLVPVTPEHYGKLHFLGLLGDVLTSNSCSQCNMRRAAKAATQKESCANLERPCIIQRVLRAWNDKKPVEAGIAESVYPPGMPNRVVILLADIAGFRQLCDRARRDLMLQLRSYLSTWLPTMPSGLCSNVDCADGRLRVVLWKRAESASAESSGYTLVAYFLSLYLLLRLKELAAVLPRAHGHDSLPLINFRIGLHADVLIPSDEDPVQMQPGLGFLVAREILGFCQPGQMLASQGYVMQLISELAGLQGEGNAQELEFETTPECRHSHAAGPLHIIGVKRMASGVLDQKTRLWDASSLRQYLERLRLPLDIVKAFDEKWLELTGLDAHGLTMEDIGSLTSKHGFRHRVFNLWGEACVAEGVSAPSTEGGFGERRPPLIYPPLIPRDATSTTAELDRLIESIQHVRHLTVYGYSNERLLSGLLERLDRGGTFAECFSKGLENLCFIFYDYDQIAHINERKSSYLARMGWVSGFLHAMRIKRMFPQKTRVLINNIRYGFNVLKAIYSADAAPSYRDQIRLTIPIPGRNFELAPVFALYRGDPWFHEYLGICERYLEEGRIENSNRITVSEYGITILGERDIDAFFSKNLGPECNYDDVWRAYERFVSRQVSADEFEAVTRNAVVGQWPSSTGSDSAVVNDAVGAFCRAARGVPRIREDMLYRQLWCLTKVAAFDAAASARGGSIGYPGFLDYFRVPT